MKRKDYMVIFGVVILSAIFSFFISGMLITSSEDQEQKVETATTIPETLTRPDVNYFNEQSVNPTQTIEISDENPNQQPFDQE